MRQIFRICVLCITVLFSVLPHKAVALKEPRAIGPDGRIHVIMYAPDEVFKFTGHYGYQSSILFEDDETILTISMGDSIPWMMNPAGNRIFLKPIEQDASTNMTVLTNKRTYLFELHAEEAKNISDPNLIFIMRFIYPETIQNVMTIDDVPDVEEEGLENFNFNYTIRGSEEVAPVAIYDDGLFTFFEFRDKNATIPAFYIVDRWGNEEIVNYRTRGDYIVVERVASRFTLRNGGNVVCVYNESRPFGPRLKQ